VALLAALSRRHTPFVERAEDLGDGGVRPHVEERGLEQPADVASAARFRLLLRLPAAGRAEVTEQPISASYCHCTRCQKANGSAFAANADVRAKYWTMAQGAGLVREYEFPDFAAALAFTNRVGALAEAANHHPDIHLAWGKVRITLWTHTANGVTQKDYDLARQIDAL